MRLKSQTHRVHSKKPYLELWKGVLKDIVTFPSYGECCMVAVEHDIGALANQI